MGVLGPVFGSIVVRATLFVALGTFVVGAVLLAVTNAFGWTSSSSGEIVELAGWMALSAGVVVALGARLWLRRRIVRLHRFIDQAEGGDFLSRLPPLGEDELGQVGASVNRLLARVTTLRVSVIDQGRELAETQEELRIREDLAAKTAELEQRLKERRLLFDVLQVSAMSTDLETVLQSLTERVAPALRLRELAILLHEGDGKYVVRAVHGFPKPEALIGRMLLEGEGITGEVARAGSTILVRDVSTEPDYLAFWGNAPREGSFAAVPILARGTMIGLLAVTRPVGDGLSDPEARLLDAIAAQAGLAIRSAQLFAEMHTLSTHDELTKLGNRRLLSSRMEMEAEHARRFQQPLCALAVDIDHFKLLNDRLGHQAGDAALVAVAEALTRGVRKVDTVARVGGEEFVVLLPRADVDEAAKVAEKLRVLVSTSQMPGGDGQPGGKLTLSIGVATFEPELDGDGDGMLARADQALYAAKRRGRDRVVVYSSVLSEAPPAISAVPMMKKSS